MKTKQLQQCVLVIARNNIEPSIIPPLQTIIPALSMIAPLTIYTSMGYRIKGENLYEALIKDLKNTQGESSLTLTLKAILDERKGNNNFRVCILGGYKISWDIILEYKRRNIMIDTAAVNLKLSQVSYTTGGIAKQVTEDSMILQFLTLFGMSRQLRKMYTLDQNKRVHFHLDCKCCNPPTLIQEQFFACSVCLAIYCKLGYQTFSSCLVCKHEFDV